MPVKISRTQDNAVVVAYCSGELSEADVCDAISFAFGSRSIEPGLDRVVMIDPKAALHELDKEALRKIQQSVLKEEVRDGREARFRSVMVCSAPMHAHLLNLYKAIWDESEMPGVEFSVVESEQEAWRILGLALPVIQREAL